MEKVNVMYVGMKPFAIDNVSGSGATWEGRGSVASVTRAQARRLLSYPDQWWLEGPVPTPAEVEASVAEFFAGRGVPADVALPKVLDEMNVEELREYALKEYGHKLSASTTSVKAAREEIDALEALDQQERGPGIAARAGMPRRPQSSKPTPATPAKPKALPRLDVDKAGRDRLEQYARTHLGVELDQRRKLSQLRSDVKKLIAAARKKAK